MNASAAGTDLRSRHITSVPQVDGGLRKIYAQDARHARVARQIVRADGAMLDHLQGVEGIEITVID